MTPPSLGSETTVVATDRHVSTTLEGETVILSTAGKGTYYGLNAVGARVWELIQTQQQVSAVCDVIVREYDVDRSRCERDVVRLLEELIAHGLVMVDEAR